MANYQRYQVLTSAQQYLFSPACPVFVSKYQISGDMETGRRLLQVRMVNLSGRELRAVYLRVVCKDERDQVLTTMHTIPITGLYVARGAVFGDSRVISLYSPRTVAVAVYPERVTFADGTAWNEPDVCDYCALPAPVPVQASDPLYPILQQTSRTGGAHNDFYFKALTRCWYCTCGVPNSNWSLTCGHCGAQREWLGAHMDPDVLLAPAAPAPEAEAETAPAPEPAPEPTSGQTGYDDWPAAVAVSPEPVSPEMPNYGYPPQAPAAYAVQEEFPDLRRSAEEEEEPERPHSAAKVVVAVLLILLLMAAAAWFGYRYLLPAYRYRQANTMVTAGQYDEAIAAFTALGDYRDCPEQVKSCTYGKALNLMQAGSYEEAFAVFTQIPDYEDSTRYAAECLYDLGVLSYNAGQTDTAWGYVERLQSEYPDYDCTDLLQCCSYSLGKQELEAGNYEAARNWFAKAGGYSDSATGMNECDYQLAALARDSGDYAAAADAFAALGDYKDSPAQRQSCMYNYAKAHLSADDATTARYLQELAEANYEDSAQLYSQLYPWSASFLLNTDEQDANNSATSIDSLSRLVIHFNVTGGAPSGSLEILMLYSLPERSGSVQLVSGAAVNDSGYVKWADLKTSDGKALPVDVTEGKVTLKFYDAVQGTELGSASMEIKKP